MTFSTLEQYAQVFEPVLILERFFPHKVRRWLEILFLIAMIALIVYILGFDPRNSYAGGGFFLLCAAWLVLVAVDAFYFSWYFRGLGIPEMTLELAAIIESAPRDDITIGFLSTTRGFLVARRAGLAHSDIEEFIEHRREPLTAYASVFDDETYTVHAYTSHILKQDSEFQSFLFNKGVQGDEFLAASVWMERAYHLSKQRRRWWSRERLSQFEGIGVEWSYGKAYLLARYSRPLRINHPTLVQADYFASYVAELESTLARSRNANALVVGEAGVGKEDLIVGLRRRILAGQADTALSNYHVVKVDVHALNTDVSSKQELESVVLAVLDQAESAGNIVVAVSIPALLRAGREYNTDIVGLLTPYLMSDDLHVIGYTDTDAYHTHVENKSKITQYFSRIHIQEGDEEVRTRILEDDALGMEAKSNVFITYPAVAEASVSAERYFADASAINKAADLLSEAVSEVRNRNDETITRADIEHVVERYTGIPRGAVEGGEREKLLNLEDELHEHIVGQNEAISAISDALRRSRSGLSDPNRPMGTFLFLGPTGVGKTETTKALARTFFGDTDRVVRLDMSEYTGPNALTRLIGSRRDNTPGVLSSKLRDNPYGVLHVDEFEKTDVEVTNLFLQILDEGVFSDANGKEVNARNTIIVATSNAGSDLIYDYLKDGGNTADHKDNIINTIIKRRTFSPELLNRFDGVVLFHPLADEHLEQIAQMLLNDFNERLKEKGVELNITSELIEFLVDTGRNPQFGARPLRRAIQDHIENAIARKLVEGVIEKGERITLDPAELEQGAVYSKSEEEPTADGGETFSFTDEER